MKIWNRKIVNYLLLPVMLIIISACNNNKPIPIHIGHDNCAWCKMGIVDMRYASELITTRGKIYKFDSIECMISFYQAHQNEEAQNAKLWVHDFLHSQEWLPANSAVFMKSDSLHSPMALNLIAVKDAAEMQGIKTKIGGHKLSWPDLLAYVKKNMNMNQMIQKN